MKRAVDPLTPQELEIMKVVWRTGSATVRDVYEELLRHRQIAYTSVMTMMNVLERKGHLRKESQDKAYLYTPTAPRERVLGGMVREFIDRVFNGSASPLLQHLIEDEKLTDADRA
ncbi:MAG: BlaI/MecI/CopY family transcriptional regulator, partial [Bryobacterales bacterium]|nr:BlaI/MecI/CopY family transcriptional regulator [Bryobacterales bacterium]